MATKNEIPYPFETSSEKHKYLATLAAVLAIAATGGGLFAIIWTFGQ